MCFSMGVLHRGSILAFGLFICFILATPAKAQNNLTGAFEGTVFDSTNPNVPIVGAIVQFTYRVNGVQTARRTDRDGRFYQGLLAPGDYSIRVTATGYRSKELFRSIFATRINVVIPVPVPLDPEVAAIPTAVQPVSPSPNPTPATQPSPTPIAQPEEEGKERPIAEDINTSNAQRGGAFPEKEASTLPLGATTLVRTFDELALLLPGVAPPPQTIDNGFGPGVGAGVGSAGQFAVNGLRSRANNFTVDGSDNNDEDIGVRRQGFLALVPQPIESIQEYQVITLLAPAQYGRNIGAQVNAISKSGSIGTHGTAYGFFNSSQLNARNFFDTTNGSAQFQLREGNQAVFTQRRQFTNVQDIFDNPLPATTPLLLSQGSGGEDSFTLGQFGFVLGGPLGRGRGAGASNRLFYFLSAEGQTLNATKERNFVVPNVAQRGAFNTGLTGLFQRPAFSPRAGEPLTGRNFTVQGSAILSLFPFPNNPSGIYGINTYTQTLPASGRGVVASGKIDGNFKVRERQQIATARYNFTDDRRDIPVTGGAIFSALRSRVRTQNFSTFLNSEVTESIFNQLRLSYGRTRLDFDELRDTEFSLSGGSGLTLPDGVTPRQLTNPAERRFLLNAPFRINVTRAPVPGIPNSGPVIFSEFPFDLARTTEYFTGPVGQVKIGGFSPLGVDVFNFPQRRVNNTYQAADTLTLHRRNHNFAFGTDIRRTELNSDLPRNSRPLITFNGTPFLNADPRDPEDATKIFVAGFIQPIDQAATALASSVFQTLATTDSAINLRYYQLNFFGQDEWRIRPNLSFSYGLRYEYNTPPRETNNRIENTFNDPALDVPGISGLRTFIAGRTKIFDSDRNNFAPRVGIAYSPLLFGNRTTVIRGGFGIFYDQILGAVVSQSRNVFPNFLTLNTGGGVGSLTGGTFGITNPASDPLCVRFENLICVERQLAVDPNTLNRLDPRFSLSTLARFNNPQPGGGGGYPGGFGATLPARQLDMPMAYHYSVSFEQQLSRNLILSAAYVGTKGSKLLRFTTPNLGDNVVTLAYDSLGNLGFLCELDSNGECISTNGSIARFFTSFRGQVFAPGTRVTPGTLGVDPRNGGPIIENFTAGGRPVPNVGSVTIFETTAESRYDALQLQMRGRAGNSLQFQIGYTFSKVTDDVSDVFDLAGAPALPQNSSTFAGEYGPANFDVRHRVAYNYFTDLPRFKNPTLQAILGNVQLAGTGQFQTGQPFTVNSIFDVNLDGNLTDRLNTTSGLTFTGDRGQPLRRPTDDPAPLAAMFLAPVGQDGKILRNSFRASNLWLTNLAVVKTIPFSEQTKLIFRTEIFNVFNRANFGIPVRFLEAPGFGQAADTVTPGRRIQFALKLAF
jgi:hypothetical protein